MHYILIYDAGTMSRTPWRAFVFALGLTALPAIIWIWQRACRQCALARLRRASQNCCPSGSDHRRSRDQVAHT